MGVDFADYDNDGRPDITVTDLSDQRYLLYHNNGDGMFSDVTNPSGVGRASLKYWGWSLVDIDNDGWKDLFVAQGHLMDNIEMTSPNLSYRQPPQLLRNSQGRFAVMDAGPALKAAWAGRGAAFGDLDNDGDIDIVVTNIGEKAYILRNAGGNQNGWIGIRARGRRSNADIGCQVKVVAPSGATQYYAISTAAGYLSASDKRVIVGLGNERSAKSIEIRWPSGVVQKMENVPAGKWIDAVEPLP